MMFLRMLCSSRAAPKAPAAASPAPMSKAPAPSAPAAGGGEALVSLTRQVQALQQSQDRMMAELNRLTMENGQRLHALHGELHQFHQERHAMDEEILLASKEVLAWFNNGHGDDNGRGISRVPSVTPATTSLP